MPKTTLKIILLLLIIGLCIGFPYIAAVMGKKALISLAIRIVIFSIAAASLNLILGFGGMISFGHAAFFGIGCYTVAILNYHFTNDNLFLGFIPGSNQLLVTLPAAMIFSAIMAFIIGGLALRTTGVQFIMITLAFAQMLFFLFVSLKVYGGDDGLLIRKPNAFLGLNLRDKTTMYYICLGIGALFFIGFWRLIHSKFGMVLSGIRQNEARMAALGLNIYRYKLAGFVIAAMGAGLAGALLANFQRFASPDLLHWTKSGELMVMVILGGVGTLIGPILGAGSYIILESGLTSWTEYWQFFLGIILLIVVLFFHKGIYSMVDLVRSKL